MIPEAKSSTCPARRDRIALIIGPFPGRIPARVFCYRCAQLFLSRASYLRLLYFVALGSIILLKPLRRRFASG